MRDKQGSALSGDEPLSCNYAAPTSIDAVCTLFSPFHSIDCIDLIFSHTHTERRTYSLCMQTNRGITQTHARTQMYRHDEKSVHGIESHQYAIYLALGRSRILHLNTEFSGILCQFTKRKLIAGKGCCGPQVEGKICARNGKPQIDCSHQLFIEKKHGVIAPKIWCKHEKYKLASFR